MKPSNFSYIRPNTLEEALQLLAEYGEDAKILAGGQSLIPVLNMRLSTPDYLIDIGRLSELDYIREENGYICIGALTKHVDVEHSSLVKEKCPLLAEAMQYIGHSQIRHRGTIGGSIAHADPSAELPCVISALRGEIVIVDEDDEEVVMPEEFFLTVMLTSLQPTQMVKEIRFPIISNGKNGSAFVEIARRHGDFALVEVAAVLEFDEEDTIINARIAIGGVNPTASAVEEVEEFLIGKKATDDVLAEASELVKDEVDPEEDLHGSVEYRKHLAAVMTKRALVQAKERALEGVK